MTVKKPKAKFGQFLNVCRRSQKLSLEHVSKKLQIPFKYIEALEFNDFKNLPAKRWKRILQKYCDFLGLEFKEIYKIAKYDLKKMSGAKQFIGKKHLIAWPKAIRVILIFVVVFIVLVFLGIKINQIFAAPYLKITNPLDNSKAVTKQIKIIGNSQKEAEIYINNNPIFVDANGRFEEEIDLQKGLNLIKINAKKKYSRTREVNLRVLLTEDEKKID